MKLINRYIAKNLLFTLLLAMGVLAFVMLATHFFRAFSLLANGVPPSILGKMLAMLLPDVLRYVLPLSMLFATVMVFSRMSAEDEIVALKASGVSIWQIVSPGLVLSIVISALGVWLALYVSPELRYRSELLKWQAMSTSPLALVEPGRMTKLSKDISIRVGSRDDNGLLRDIHLLQLAPDGKTLRDITAASGIIENRPGQQALHLILQNFAITEFTVDGDESQNLRKSKDAPSFLSAQTITIPIEYGAIQDRKPLKRKLKMMPLGMLFGDLAMQIQQGKPTTEHWLEFHQRLALAFSPLGFLLLGIPFGIRNRRSDSSSGIIVCVILALIFYAFILLSDSLADHPAFHPEFLIWVPNLVYEIGGLVALAKLSKH